MLIPALVMRIFAFGAFVAEKRLYIIMPHILIKSGE